MLSKLFLRNVGPLPDGSYKFAKRINALTGDNGLGKTFLLDLVWFAFTNDWPAMANPAMTSGYMAQPGVIGRPASITFDIQNQSRTKLVGYTAKFDRGAQKWKGRAIPPSDAGIAIYSLSDGSFCVWDPVRNGFKNKADNPNYEPSFAFTENEIWNGQDKHDRSPGGGNRMIRLLQGLLVDWRLWQTDPESKEFPALKRFLASISAENMKIGIGMPRKTSLSDVRDVPTLRLPYGEVPVLWASAAFRRILTLAYVLAWAYSEHVKSCEFVGKKPCRQIALLVDELDAHLHPKWQRAIMPSLMTAVEQLVASFSGDISDGERCDVQIFISTHSPLVMASMEDLFDDRKDRWFDFDCTGNCREITCEERVLERRGGADEWLKSEAFDLSSTRSLKVEELLNYAADLLDSVLSQGLTARKMRKDLGTLPIGELKRTYAELMRRLPPNDRFLSRFRLLCAKCDLEVE